MLFSVGQKWLKNNRKQETWKNIVLQLRNAFQLFRIKSKPKKEPQRQQATKNTTISEKYRIRLPLQRLGMFLKQKPARNVPEMSRYLTSSFEQNTEIRVSFLFSRPNNNQKQTKNDKSFITKKGPEIKCCLALAKNG